ncbi:cytochrome c-type biogenesis protein CcmH [Gammaproteobacteria bacterium]|nr:cytochrome c-type biogenesis protein CcmH [Gammaproteobacteria bacterium]
MLNKFLFLFFISFTLLAESYYDFQNDEDEKRFFNLIKEIRCPKCTSGSLASSNAPVSEDLKKIIAEMIEDNKSNEDIKSYVSDRFGKETLYDTPIEPKTYALWYSPFVFLLVCLMIFFFRKKA